MSFLFQVMQRHTDDVELLTDLFNTVANFTGKAKLPRLAQLLPFLVQMLQREAASPHTLQPLCRALVTASVDASNQQCITQNGGIKALVQTILGHKTQIAVHMECYRALANISTNEACVAQMISSGAIKAIESTAQVHAKIPDLMALSCRLLTGLMRDPAGRSQLPESEAVSIMLGVLTNHKRHQAAMQLTCGALSKFCQQERIPALVAQQGGIPVILQVPRHTMIPMPCSAFTPAGPVIHPLTYPPPSSGFKLGSA